jgi:hypothetical protein
MGNETEVGLLKEAKLLMKVRNYQMDKLVKNEATVDIMTSKPDSDQTILMRIVNKSKLVSNVVGVEKVRETNEILEEQDIDKIIMFGSKFTSAARKELRREDIEFFSKEEKILSTLTPQELYSTILDYVTKLCQIKCGRVPESESECEGFSKDLVKCSYCSGNGKLGGSYRKYNCPICGGVGSKANHYSCRVRLISDNADFHYKNSWITLLQNDLRSLLEILLSTNPDSASFTHERLSN